MTVVAEVDDKNADLAQIGRADINRIRWHCRRGMLELDMVLARFLDTHGTQLSAPQWQEFERLLDLADQELWQRIRDQTAPASAVEQWLHDGFSS